MFDVIGGEVLDRSAKLVRSSGTLVTIAEPPRVFRPDDRQAVFFVVEPDRGQLAALEQRFAGWSTPSNRGCGVPLAEARSALDPTRRARGNTIIQVADDELLAVTATTADRISGNEEFDLWTCVTECRRFARPSGFRVTVTHMEGTTRPYRMTARAVTTARTATAILEATWELFEDRPFAEITLADIAGRSGVTTQTVLRRFGDKDAVFAAMFAKLGTDVVERRGRVHPNAIEDIVTNFVDNYELSGRLMLKMLAEEATTPAVRDFLAAGRTSYRNWCRTVFYPAGLQGHSEIAGLRSW